MENREWVSAYHGMELQPIADDAKRHNENGVLFWLIYLLLKEEITEEEKELTNSIILNLRTHGENKRYMGLFDRGKDESKNLPKPWLRTISHDNLTAISRLSELLDLPYAKAIADHGIENLMIYDNVQPESPRLFYKAKYGKHRGKWTSRLQHPRDWHYWLYNGGYKKSSMIFYPIFALANIITCFGQGTSGKWLMFARLFKREEFHYKVLFKICNFILKRKYGKGWINKIAEIYYHQRADHPIRVLAKEYKN